MALRNLDLSEIPEKSIILIEEDIGSVERVFLHRIVFDCLGAGKRVLYLSTHTSREDVIAEMSSYSFFDPGLADSENMRIEGYFNNLPEVADMAVEFDVCIIDPFSALIMNK
ncbi:MAG: hypothetical protein U9Q22_01300, partial [Candidatus Altiarchaeota archaeon]|nr:hypothetical protein [Candidatus Altiarchaeota archaeon]